MSLLHTIATPATWYRPTKLRLGIDLDVAIRNLNEEFHERSLMTPVFTPRFNPGDTVGFWNEPGDYADIGTVIEVEILRDRLGVEAWYLIQSESDRAKHRVAENSDLEAVCRPI